MVWCGRVWYCAGVMGRLTRGGTDVCGNKELCRGHTEAFYTLMGTDGSRLVSNGVVSETEKLH